MKIIDKFLMKAFIPTFCVSFGIALFTLIMQVLWLYIDDLMGKGLTIFEITELVAYLSMTLVPTALELAVLVASVMVMGDLAESYELSSMKSAGIGLVRIIRPLLMAGCVVMLFSFFISEKMIPWANLKSYSRLHAIRKARPTLALQEGVFINDFKEYTLRIGKKGSDQRSLEDVMVSSNSVGKNGYINQSHAKKGEMFPSADKRFIVLNLFDGTQFQETQGTLSQEDGSKTYPFMRIKYKSWQKLFDLTALERQGANEDQYQNQPRTKNSKELLHMADSVRQLLDVYIADMNQTISAQFSIKRFSDLDTLNSKDTNSLTPSVKQHEKGSKIFALDSISRNRLAGTPYAEKVNGLLKPDTLNFKKLAANFYDIYEIKESDALTTIYSSAADKARTAKQAAEMTLEGIDTKQKEANYFIYIMHLKYNFAIMCLVFLFIGAPMGAIIQKGGFGMPILVAIGFFLVYYLLFAYSKGFDKSTVFLAIFAAWFSVLIMIPLAALLTYGALIDYKFVGFDPVKILKSFKINRLVNKTHN
jgi:lipopolysaccharide export system permease protein